MGAGEGCGFGGGAGGASGVDEAEGGGVRGEAEVAVVLAEEETVFGATGEHAIGFGDVFGDEVVEHDTEVGFGAAWDP